MGWMMKLYTKSTRQFQIVMYEAMEQPDGSYLNNQGTIAWYNKEGKVHKEDGPAIITNGGDILWYHHGTRYSFANWLTVTPASEEHKMLLRLQYE
jgi:hypothetical protein